MKTDHARRLALPLPAATEARHFEALSFRGGGRIFATSPPAGDELHVFIDDHERDRALALQPICTERLPWGGKVVGVRVKQIDASSACVRERLVQAWRRKSPKRLRKVTTP